MRESLFFKNDMTIEDFASCIYDLVQRCSLDTDSDKTSHHFRIEDTFVDMMFRDHLIISVSAVKRRSCTDDEEEDEGTCLGCESLEIDTDSDDDDDDESKDEVEDEEEDEDEENGEKHDPVLHEVTQEELVQAAHENFMRGVNKKDKKQTPKVVQPEQDTKNAFDLLSQEEADESKEEHEIAWPEEEEASLDSEKVEVVSDTRHLPPSNDTGEWETVVSKRTKRSFEYKARQDFLKKQQENMKFFFFLDDANCNFMDFSEKIRGLDNLIQLAKKEKWSHGYCLENNTVYDFKYPDHPGKYRRFVANGSYVHKFEKWYHVYQDNGNRAPVDNRVFYVFQESSIWSKWKYLGKTTGLCHVRRQVKEKGFQWAHAYCPKTNQLINFALRDERLSQKLSSAPAKYIDRFHEFFETLKKNGNTA